MSTGGGEGTPDAAARPDAPRWRAPISDRETGLDLVDHDLARVDLRSAELEARRILAQPSGGYPKIGTVIEADLWRLGQAPIGSRIRFVQCSWDEALAALTEVRRWLANARRLIDLHCGQGAGR